MVQVPINKRGTINVAPVVLAWRHTRSRWIIGSDLVSIYVRNADLRHPPYISHGDYEILFIHGLPLILDAVAEKRHDIVIEWYDNTRNRINIDGFAIVTVLSPTNYILIYSRYGSAKIMTYWRFKQLIEGINTLSISDADKESLIKTLKNKELVLG